MLRRLLGVVLVAAGLCWSVAVLGSRSWLAPFVFVLYAALWRRLRRRRRVVAGEVERRDV